MKQFGQLLLIHLREFYREPAVLFWALVFPAALAVVLGFAFRSPAEQIVDVGLIAESASSETGIRSEQADLVKRRIDGLGGFRVHVYNEETAGHALKRGRVRLVVVVQRSGLIFRYDPASDTAVKEAALLKAALLTEALINQGRGEAPGEAAADDSSGTGIREEKLSIPGTRYIDYLIPGLLAFGVMNSCLWGVGWSLISLRMKKLLRRMAAAPMDQNLFFLSFATARILLVTVEAAFLMLIAYLFFDLVPSGSLLSLFLMLVSGIFCFAGLAVLLACRTGNTQVGNGLINAAVMPMMLVSGVFFSYHGFPEFLQPVIRALPLTVLADSVRAVYLEGQGIADLGKPVLILVASGAAMFTVGRRFFHWG